jgi:urea-proton symporter
MSSSNSIQVLTPGAGYGIVIGVGAFFALIMLGITYLQNRYTMYNTSQSEEFNTASRSVKTGPHSSWHRVLLDLVCHPLDVLHVRI